MKILASIIKHVNNDETIDISKIEYFINIKIDEYYIEIIKLTNEVNNALGDGIDFSIASECKKLFYKIAKIIHPDLHPDLVNNSEILDLWQSVVDFHKRYLFDELKKIYDVVVLKTNNMKFDLNVDYEAKINELTKKME